MNETGPEVAKTTAAGTARNPPWSNQSALGPPQDLSTMTNNTMDNPTGRNPQRKNRRFAIALSTAPDSTTMRAEIGKKKPGPAKRRLTIGRGILKRIGH